MRRALVLALLVAGCGGGSGPARPPAATDTPAATPEQTATAPAAAAARGQDWTRFGYDAAKTNAAPRGISPSGVAKLRVRRVALPGTVDSSPIYLARVRVAGRT